MPFTYSRFIYFDTNHLSYLLKAENAWASLRKFLFDNDLTIAVSGVHLAELSNFRRNHKNLSKLLISVPSALVKTHESIISEEVKAYPSIRSEDLLYYPLQLALTEQHSNVETEVERLLGSYDVTSARASLDHHASLVAKRLQELKPNFNTSRSGNYVKEQASLFSKEIVWQWFSQSNPGFIRNKQKEGVDSEKFQSIWIIAQMIFFRYYLGNREFKKTSDFGDLHHCAFLPYCNVVVLETDMATLLKQIQKNNPNVLKAEIYNINFLYDHGWKAKPLK